MAAIPQPNTRISPVRINILVIVCMLVALVCAGKLINVQLLNRHEWATLARQEFERSDTLLPRRGMVKDRLGNVLAMNVDRDSLWVSPQLIKNPEKLALTISPLLGLEPDVVYERLTAKSKYLRLARWLTPEASAQIAALDEPGLSLVPEPKRIYPLGEFGAHIVGIANWEGQGITGVEAAYNELLTGVNGTLTAERDAAMRPIAIAPNELVPPRHGADLTLTIDPTVQKIIEEELRTGVERNNASGGSIIVLDPQTGEVLGMASWPPFDPNRYQDYPEDTYNRNAAITDLYEPGSTFKMINLAAGLDSGAFTVDTVVNDTGVIGRYGYSLQNWNAAGNGMVTPEKVIYYSSNVGALQFAELTGPERFYDYLRRFGYGEPTGIELAGEQSGMVLWPEVEGWSMLTLDTNAYGQGIAVTPLQHIRAIAAIANGGLLMEPHIVKAWCEEEECHEVEPRVIRRVVSQETTDLLRPMLVKSANSYGTQITWIQQCGLAEDVSLVPGYKIAAKTGTSSIPVNGVYDPSATIGSVAGFGPVDNPRVAVIVKFDRPKDLYGVMTAVPVYQKVMSKLMTYYRIPPDPALIAPCQQEQPAGQ